MTCIDKTKRIKTDRQLDTHIRHCLMTSFRYVDRVHVHDCLYSIDIYDQYAAYDLFDHIQRQTTRSFLTLGTRQLFVFIDDHRYLAHTYFLFSSSMAINIVTLATMVIYISCHGWCSTLQSSSIDKQNE
jgi:hypothetical protein